MTYHQENTVDPKTGKLLVTRDRNAEAYTESMSRSRDGRGVIQQWCGGVIQTVVDRDRVLSNLFIRM